MAEQRGEQRGEQELQKTGEVLKIFNGLDNLKKAIQSVQGRIIDKAQVSELIKIMMDIDTASGKIIPDSSEVFISLHDLSSEVALLDDKFVDVSTAERLVGKINIVLKNVLNEVN